MIRVSKSATGRLIDIHGWTAVLFGLALYVVVLTGALAVFSHEIGAWSVGGHGIDDALAGPLDHRLSELTREVPEKYHEELTVSQNAAGYLVAFFHTHEAQAGGGLPEDVGVRFVIDPANMQVVSREEGFADDLPDVSSSFLHDFLVDLHVRLYTPDPVGLYLTGLLGLILLVSAVSGFILHRHLIMDMFLSPRQKLRELRARDRHTLAGTWSLLFAVIVAFTGAFFSFATTLGLPVIAMTAFEGDQQKAIEVVIGVPEEEDPTPASFIGLEPVIRHVQTSEAAGSLPVFVLVEHMGRADARITTFHDPSDGALFTGSHVYSGVDGSYRGEKPALGKSPSLGSDLVSLMGVLHFGLFAGFMSKVIWLALGLATCYLTYSGLNLWCIRREKSTGWRLMSRLNDATAYGTAFALTVASAGFLLSYGRGPEKVVAWTLNGFVSGVIVSLVLALLLPSGWRTQQMFQRVLGLSLIALPVLRLAMSPGPFAVHGLDLTLLISGLLSLIAARRSGADRLRATERVIRQEVRHG
ncbi:PepSY-associated TM helix domain-containing protein [uncultured Thalassolituus sp.]|uniref:PepSY-associated TM helix domain-containing protein n=1 Tax=uncultured Thalassolituus sp. TaxID=285273 RepID=UPI0026039ECC|nr:PepSY-associated TM helix domain-containing protein [uncultured Thalassolituus sp.]